jgi:NAD(P)H-hydrate repair Nnr-like enzyme with NAD(P)H-hydrate dehydratase domain
MGRTMSANDIVNELDKLGITKEVIINADPIFNIYDRDSLLDMITIYPHKGIIARFVGSKHPIMKIIKNKEIEAFQ